LQHASSPKIWRRSHISPALQGCTCSGFQLQMRRFGFVRALPHDAALSLQHASSPKFGGGCVFPLLLKVAFADEVFFIDRGHSSHIVLGCWTHESYISKQINK
jgi:hypothetical protein